MDLTTVTDVLRPHAREDLTQVASGDAWLAGGTWLFSEPQAQLRRLVDLSRMGWTPLEVSGAGLSIASTCSVAALDALEPPADWRAGWLLRECCRAFLASFKIWNMATVGGNICLGLPAGPMTSLASALEGEALIWGPDGAERRLPVADFVRGPLDVALAPGELLRAIEIPARALCRAAAFRRASLTPLGRSGVLLIGTRGEDDALRLTVTAATRHPVVIAFAHMPGAEELAAGLDAAIPDRLYYDDIHGRPDWRRHMTFLFAQEIRDELAGGGA